MINVLCLMFLFLCVSFQYLNGKSALLKSFVTKSVSAPLSSPGGLGCCPFLGDGSVVVDLLFNRTYINLLFNRK